MARPPNSRLARVAIIVLLLGALIWIISLTGISLSSKSTMDEQPEPVGRVSNAS